MFGFSKKERELAEAKRIREYTERITRENERYIADRRRRDEVSRVTSDSTMDTALLMTMMNSSASESSSSHSHHSHSSSYDSGSSSYDSGSSSSDSGSSGGGE